MDKVIERLPQNAGDDIRTVKVGDYNACPCIGPHIGSKKVIGGFRITSISFKGEVLRIIFRLQN
jgi:misacylated tRNA(Ala) deacylase